MSFTKWVFTTVFLTILIVLTIYVGTTGAFFVDEEQSYDDSLGFRWGALTIDDSFEGDPWDEDWNDNGTTTWVQSQAQARPGGQYSALSNRSHKGYLNSDSIDASDADHITISFWYYAGNLTSGDVLIEVFDGNNYNTLQDLRTHQDYSEGMWCKFSAVINSSQYLIPGFELRFNSFALTAGTDAEKFVYIDDVGINMDNQAPSAPANLQATPGDTKVFLGWDASPEYDVAGYNIYRSANGTGFSEISHIYTSTNFTDTGLINDTLYYYIVTAVDYTLLESDNSTQVSTTPYNMPPEAPTGLTATAGDKQAFIDWNDNTEPDLAGYNLYRSMTSGYGFVKINTGTIPSGTSNYTDTELIGGDTYFYIVTALDTGSLESENSTEANVTPYDNPPAAPTGLQAVPGINLVELSWNAVNESDMSGYNVYRKTATTAYGKINTSLVTSTNYTDIGLPGGVTFYFVVTAVDLSDNESGYSNEVSAVPEIEQIEITSIGTITGTAMAGYSLTAGAVTPSGATVTWQWQKSPSESGTYTDISLANSNSYVLTSGDIGYYIRVVATGTGTYYGTVTSDPRGPVTADPTIITAIDNIIGTPRVGATLQAGPLTPVGANATYQWKRCITAGGTYEDIPGAVTNTYTVADIDYGYYLKVTATGTGIYSGSATSLASAQVAEGVITGIADIIGTTQPGEILTAGEVYPLGANVTYQWQTVSDSGTANISGATSNTLLLTGAQINQFIRVVVTGTGAYSGTIASALTKSRVTSTITPIESIAGISGQASVGSILTAGALTPEDATATYQWQRSATANGTCENITGAASITYTLTSNDYGHYIRVVATGSGAYSGVVTSTRTGPVTAGVVTSIGNIIGTTAVGQTLTAGAITPAGATVNYQWRRSQTIGGTYTDISGATTNIYTIVSGDTGYYFKVKATGTGSFSGTVTSAATGPVSANSTPVTAIGNIGGTLKVGRTLTAGVLTPSGATVTYQWLRCATSNGSYDQIAGATSSSYTVTAGDFGYYFKVTATGSGTYSGTVTSASTSQVAAGDLVSISDIIGTTAQDQTVYAGTVTPLGATVTWQWQVSQSGNPSVFNDIAGATENAYHFLRQDYVTRYVRVAVTGYGSYTGTVYSNPAGPVTASVTPVTAIADIIGTPQVGQTLTSGAVTPSGASVTWQWQRSQTSNGTYEIIAGATSSTYAVAGNDYSYYIRVVATGSGAYSGVVTSNPTTQVTQATITAISPITGTTTVGQTLTAGTLTPSTATADYQWQRSLTSGGTYQDIPGETTNTYIIGSGDTGYYIKVKAIGTGSYSGTVTSAATGPVVANATALVSIGNIIGTVRVGNTIHAGTLTPSGATVTYQWQRCDTIDGTYQNISGATSGTYIPAAGDFSYYLKIVATGAGSYSGSVTSNASGPVAAGLITGITDIVGTTAVGETITAGTVSPAGATVTYQWQASQSGSPSAFTNIQGATSSTYYFQWGTYINRYIRVVVTGTGSYTGTVNSTPAGPVTSSATEITAIGDISGTTQIGQTLTAGALTPSGASATYQWQKAPTVNGTWSTISGATQNTYVLSGSDYGYYLRVVATGSGAFSGVVTSNPAGPVTSTPVTGIGPISGSTQIGETLTAGSVTPSGATVTWQWQRCDTSNGTFADISGATTDTYTVVAGDTGYYIRVTVTGTGSYYGTVTSAPTGPVTESTTPLTGVAISGTLRLAETLTAVDLTPSGATATYQWQRCNVIDGVYENISGATSGTYVLTGDDYQQYIKVVATGSGSYSGTVTSAAVGTVGKGIITGIGDIIGEPIFKTTISAGQVYPVGATVTYQWQNTWYIPPTGEPSFSNISGATSSTLYLAHGGYGGYLRVVVTGTGAWEGTAVSNYTVKAHN